MFDAIVDILFVVDMVLMFMTSYQDSKGKEVKSSYTIAGNYMKSVRFVADFLACLANGFIAQFAPFLKIFGIFKIVRVFRLSRLIMKLNTHKEIKAMISMIKLTFYLFLLIHMLTCAWYANCLRHVDVIDETGRNLKWYPPTDWINYKESKLFTDEISIFEKYLISLYNGILIIGFNELGPVNASEFALMTFMLLTCSIINAQLFGEIAMMVSVIQEKGS